MIRRSGEGGIAMIVVLLMMLLVSTLLVGFTASIMSDQRFRYIDRDHYQAFYGAHAGLEKLTTDLGNLFQSNFAPKAANINALTATAPSLPGIAFTAAGGAAGSGYAIAFTPDVNGNPKATNTNVSSGPYQGLIALLTPYTINVTARTATGLGEVHLVRSMETVAIPVFQFGMFSSTDLSFFAGSNFNFGGRIATNGNLFLAEGDGNTLTISSNATAALDVIRTNLSNGAVHSIAPTHQGTVSMDTAPGAFRNLLATEGSLVGFLGSAANPNWTTISLTTYNGLIRNKLTGARPLNLPIVTAGGANADIVRRPCSPATPSVVGQPAAACTENVTNPVVFLERYFTKTSLRILLSDTSAEITNLPTLTATAPIPLGEVLGVAPDWKTAVPVGSGLVAVDATHPPIARSPGSIPVTFKTNAAGTAGDTFIAFTGAPPAIFHMPVYGMVITPPLPAVITQTVTCTSTTATTFVGCVPLVNWFAMAVPSTITVTVDGIIYKSAISAAIVAAANKTARTLTITGGTAPWATNTFWVPDNANANAQTLVTCTGVDTFNSHLTTCSGVPKTAANAPLATNALSAQNTGLIGGFIKIEMQNAAGVWSDVTAEIMNYGIAGPSLYPGNTCPGNPNAILQIQRLKDTAGGCPLAGSLDSYDYWPNVLFDPREGTTRGVAPANANFVVLGGVMYYIALDVTNLSKWLTGAAPYAAGTGVNAQNSNGFSVYFSDRRNNNNAASLETGDYGFEDFVNPTDVAGAPNGVLDVGEDVNFNGVLDTYGQFPSYNGVANSVPAAAAIGAAPLDINVRPYTPAFDPAQAQVNRSLLYRHALKLINGGLGNIVAPGLTIVTENPVYLQGSWNMNAAVPVAGDGHVSTSIIADAVTILSDNWNDDTMFQNPYSPGNRPRSANTYYRVAIIAGKNLSFPRSPGPAAWAATGDFGTDGGAHNFLRMLEGTGQTVNYLGSIATFYYSRQATGIYKGGSGAIYDTPTRAFSFDTDFLNPTLLPPLTPVFRDVDTLGFTMEIRPGK